MCTLSGWEECLHESMETWLWRQDVLLFACLSGNHEFEKVFELKTQQATLFTHSFVSWNLENLYKKAV